MSDATPTLRQVGRFTVRATLLMLPLLAAMAIYVACDPFRVLRDWRFGNYYDETAPVEVNRDYASLHMFFQNDPSHHFDSFLMGSSRSFPFHCDAWQRFIGTGRPFHYPAASENLHGVLAKLEYLDRRGVPLRHVLFELSPETLGDVTARRDHLHALPREITGESAWDFQSRFLQAYFTDWFFVKYDWYRLRGRVPSWGADALGVAVGQVRIDPMTNDYYFLSNDREIAADGEAYYHNPHRFAAPDAPVPGCQAPVVGEAQRTHLRSIRAIMDRHHTDYRFMILPRYKQPCLAAEDRAAVRAILGAEHVFDLSGPSDFSADVHNFYDDGHLQPRAAERVLEWVYAAPR